MNGKSDRSADSYYFVLFSSAITVLGYFIYFYSNPHYFQGDTIHWFYVRYRTVGQFFDGFLTLDPGGWYRPLTNRGIQSLFFPVFGLHPNGYRAVHFLLFMSAVLATHQLALAVTRKRLAAAIGTVFFAVHTVNSYTTYDVAFTPEVVYTTFYVFAAVAYLRYRETAGRRFFLVSVTCFVLGLFSKESSVTLPAALVALDVILNQTPPSKAIAAARVHIAILAVYAVLVFGYLGVQRPAFKSILKRPGPEVAYRFALDRTILTNAGQALTWALNLPSGWQTEARHLDRWQIRILKIFAAGMAVLAFWILFRPERRWIAAGLLWFFIGIGPALPLFEHFLPYYLFLPLAGFSIAIGVLVETAYRKLAEYHAVAAMGTLAVTGAILTGICAMAVRNDSRDNRSLGWSSRLAQNSIEDLQRQHPWLQPNTTIYLSDAEEPDLSWDTSQGELFRMAYADESIQSLYWGWGEVITKGIVERGPVVVMKYSKFHLFDVTQEFLAASVPPVAYHAIPKYQLEIQPAMAAAGQRYWLSIKPLGNEDVSLHYTLNGGPVQAFETHLNGEGRSEFDVSSTTEKGLYKFVGFRINGSEEWIQAAGSIRID